jgi:hypothetical protein
VSSGAPGIAPARAADFARLVALTESLRAHVERGDWGGAAELEAERRLVVERVFDDTPTAAELPTLTATLREVVRLNDELIGLAEHRRRGIARELDLVAVGRAANRAYTNNAGAWAGQRP